MKVDIVDTRHGADPAQRVAFDLVPERALGDRECQPHVNGGTVNPDVRDHPEFDDVSAQLRVLHSFECFENIIPSDHRGQ